jgi:transketolase
MANHLGLDYIRTTRPPTPVIYDNKEEFKIGGSKIVLQGKTDKVTVVAAGITLHEAIKVAKELGNTRVIDAYSVKPIDAKTIIESAKETGGKIITVEDHRPEGGLGSAVLEAVADQGFRVFQLAVNKIPGSGKMAELLAYEEIDSAAIAKMVKSVR